MDRLACNAITISAPGHPFWLHIMEYARKTWKNAKDKSDVLSTTGPKMMNEGVACVRSVSLTHVTEDN